MSLEARAVGEGGGSQLETRDKERGCLVARS